MAARAGCGRAPGCHFFVDAKDHGALRRVEIQPDDVAQLRNELRVDRQLEPRGAMRLQTMLMPDGANRLLADALGARHRAGTPVRRAGRRRQSGGHDRGNALGRERRPAARAGRVPEHAADSVDHIALHPVVHMIAADAQSPCDLGGQHDTQTGSKHSAPPYRITPPKYTGFVY